ncbi:DUF6065 family protein [Litorimonas haliclonae]|uniref:DUF6065 family protein n=1 Tax=Litorimonas haliclonae TaxID=2081977 RepID=UPI0039EFE5F0
MSELFLDCYKIMDPAPEIIAGRSRRAWMDGFPDRHAYRCLPLTMANSTGWELLCPFDVTLEWDGGPSADALKVTGNGPPDMIKGFALSHFTMGIITFYTGHLFRTPPGWAVLCSGPPNQPKHGIGPLSALVETDWLPYPFTMNWQMTAPGKVSFKKGEPFCFITLIPHHELESIQPRIKDMESDFKLKRDFKDWQSSRSEFLERLEKREGKAVAEKWQRLYMRGEMASGEKGPPSHLTKRRLKNPKPEEA